MEIVFGIDNLDLTDPVQDSCVCPACQKKGIFVRVKKVWFQFMFLPVIPLGKRIQVFCMICKTEFKGPQITGALLDYVIAEKKRRKGIPAAVMNVLVLALVAFLIIMISRS